MTEPPSLPPNPSPPTKYALILYPNFEVLDVFGPLEALNTVSRIGPPAFTAPPPAPPDTEILTINPPLSLYILAETLDPVYSGETKTGPFCQAVVPTHTFDDAPDDIEVLMVPGGIGDSVAASEFIKQRFGSIRYLFSVCTGANIVARAKVLNGWRATTNKKAWVSLCFFCSLIVKQLAHLE
jgi:putative intracellular protease/amidase